MNPERNPNDDAQETNDNAQEASSPPGITMPEIPGVDYTSPDWPLQWLESQTRDTPTDQEWQNHFISAYSSHSATPTLHTLQQLDSSHPHSSFSSSSSSSSSEDSPSDLDIIDWNIDLGSSVRESWLTFLHDATAPQDPSTQTALQIRLIQLEGHIGPVQIILDGLLLPEEYSYPPSDSEPDDNEISEGRECNICGRREARVRFQGCMHAACSSCTKGIWGARKQAEGHFPEWFPCHQCRGEVTRVGVVERGVERWVLVREWMAGRSRRVREGLERL